MVQSCSAEVEHELLSPSSDSWTDAQQPNPCTSTVLQCFAEHVSLPTDDPFEEFTEEDMATGSMAVVGRSPNKHPRTGSEEDSVDIAALLDRAADRFSACMDTKVDSMMDRLEKRLDEKIDSKLGPVMDRLSVHEKTSSSARSGPSSLSDNGGSAVQSSAAGGNTPVVYAPSYLEIKGWCGFPDRNTHGLTEAQAREIIAKLRQGIGPDLDFLIAHVGAMRVRNTKIICYLKTPSLSSCKQIREAMNAFIEKENIKLGPQGSNSLCGRGETCLETGATEDLWESIGSG